MKCEESEFPYKVSELTKLMKRRLAESGDAAIIMTANEINHKDGMRDEQEPGMFSFGVREGENWKHHGFVRGDNIGDAAGKVARQFNLTDFVAKDSTGQYSFGGDFRNIVGIKATSVESLQQARNLLKDMFAKITDPAYTRTERMTTYARLERAIRSSGGPVREFVVI